MDPLTCFLEANPNAKRIGEIAYNGCILPIITLTSITDFADLHFIDEVGDVHIDELGNTGEYIAINIME